MTTSAPCDQLKIYSVGRGLWRCESGMNNYKIVDLSDGRYQCNCAARVECRHVKQLKELLNIQKAPFDSAQGKPVQPTDRRQTDRRTTPDLTPVLESLREKVDRLESALSQVQQLGFTSDRTYVFIDSKYGGCWYTLTRDNQPQPIEAFSLNGYIRKLEFKSCGEGAKATSKLLCYVEADRQYILRTGHDTHFAKGLLMAISVMPPEKLARPVRINPQASKSTILCNLHQDGALIRARHSADTDWRSISIKAMENLRGSNQYQNQ
jgi:hypothetical protein